MDGVQTDTDSPQARISRRIVQMHKEYYGRGPEKAKTYLQDDVVVVVLRGVFTPVEETLLRDGRGEAVVRQRTEFQEVMAETFKQMIAEETGRDVVAFMSNSHQHPDLNTELFILSDGPDGASSNGDFH